MESHGLDSVSLGPLTLADRPAASNLLLEAFVDSAACIYILPDETARRERLPWLMNAGLDAQLAVGRSFGAHDAQGDLAAMGFWYPPAAPGFSLSQIARFGYLGLPFRLGWTASLRMAEAFGEFERRRREALSGRESWYLNNVGVAAPYRQLGLGDLMLRRQLLEVVDPSGHPASLVAPDRENVSFYLRLGFKIADERVVGRGPNAFRNWIMVYEPK